MPDHPTDSVETLVIGAGQAGLAASRHLAARNLPHLVLERGRIAERWRTERWDSLVANGPAWHDRFPDLAFQSPADAFPSRDDIVAYFEAFAHQVAAPIRTGVTVRSLRRTQAGGFRAETSAGPFHARSVIAATGPFQRPAIPSLVPASPTLTQLHSSDYRNPAQLPPGAVLVVGAGSSGVQIAEELARAGRRVFLAVGPHNRPPRRYRGHDYCWWLGVLGKWSATAPKPGAEHVTIAVSGARGGHTIDFRSLAASGITLLGRALSHDAGTLHFAPDLAANIARGDADYLSVLAEADAYATLHQLDLPEEPDAHILPPAPAAITDPPLSLSLARDEIATILYATGYTLDFSWLDPAALDPAGHPIHQSGISPLPGLYFLGLPWLTSRSSSFIWGAYRDADSIAAHIALHRPQHASAA